MVLDENAKVVPLNATFYKLDLLHKMTYRQTDWHLKSQIKFSFKYRAWLLKRTFCHFGIALSTMIILFFCPPSVSKQKLISKPPVKANTFSSDLKKESRTKDIVEVEAAKKFSDLLLLRNQTDSREHQQHLPFYFYCHLGLPHIAICKENFWLIVCCMFKCTSAKQRSGEHCQQSG